MLPVMIMGFYGEVIAGLYLGFFNLFQAFVLNPIVGNFADKYGAKKLLIISSSLLFIDALLFMFSEISVISIVVFTCIYFVSYSLRIADTYILRVASKSKGGFVFGIYNEFKAVAYLLATLSIPFFTITNNYIYAAGLLILISLIDIYLVFRVADDLKEPKEISLLESFNVLTTIKSGFKFVKKNKGYPILILTASVFEGVFHGAIWFLFPIHLVSTGISNGFYDSLQLGIYEIVTIFLAGYLGFLADKFNWKHIHTFGWSLAILGVILMPIFSLPLGLVISGFIIALGSNLFFSASEHVLEKFDFDHQEDGEFISLKNVILDISYGISPIIMGILYHMKGFETTLAILAGIIAIVGLFIIRFAWKLEK